MTDNTFTVTRLDSGKYMCSCPAFLSSLARGFHLCEHIAIQMVRDKGASDIPVKNGTVKYNTGKKRAVLRFATGRELVLRGVTREQATRFMDRYGGEWMTRDGCLTTSPSLADRPGLDEQIKALIHV